MRRDRLTCGAASLSILGLVLAAAPALIGCVKSSPADGGSGGSPVGSGGVTGETGGHGSGGTSGTGGGAGTGTGGAASGGTSGTGGDATTGTGGAATTGTGGAAGVTDGGQPVLDAGSDGGGSSACPSNAYFCSGFEEASGLPVGATYISSNDGTDITKGLALDTSVFNTAFGGKQSIEVLKIGSYSQRQIQIPAATTFWFRVYLRTDTAIGGAAGNNHNAFISPIWTGEDKGVEIVEEDCELGVNINDTRYGSDGLTNQPGCPTAAPLGVQLAANTWQCIEGFFDGTKGDFTVYANGQAAITQTGIDGAKQAFNGLRFGYRQYHERQRLVWYDDVVTAPQRIPCQ
jgi:hypothetical protein